MIESKVQDIENSKERTEEIEVVSREPKEPTNELQKIPKLGEILSHPLPNDIYKEQMGFLYQKDQYKFLEIWEENSAIRLPWEIPYADRPETTFGGLLYLKNRKWEKYLEVITSPVRGYVDNHNIHDFWTIENYIFLAVIDSRGAGSGEGVMKVFSSKNYGKTFELSQCFYYSPLHRISSSALIGESIGKKLDSYEEYPYNSKTDTFEYIVANEDGEMETYNYNEDCKSATIKMHQALDLS